MNTTDRSKEQQLLDLTFPPDEIDDTVRMLKDISAGVNVPIRDLIELYCTVKIKGFADRMDISHFTSFGIPIIRELAKQLNVETKDVITMSEENAILFEHVSAAFKELTQEGGLFNGIYDKIQSHPWLTKDK